MNDPMVLEASRVLAERLMDENSEVHEKIVKAFRMIVCRTPAEQEITLLMKAFETELATLSQESAEDLLQAGEFPQSSKADSVKVAALMLVVNTIYNLEESITKT
jgi:hypothetical protein